MTSRTVVRARADTQTATRLRLVVARLARAMRQHGAAGLTPSQLSALATIEEFGPIRLSDVAGHECVCASVATRVVATLEELGHVERIADTTDRRACLIDLTDAGRSVLQDLWGERTAGLSSRIERLSTADVRVLNGALAVLEALVRDHDPSAQR
jgi:DNA-binding MarR family transcriptional regulator